MFYRPFQKFWDTQLTDYLREENQFKNTYENLVALYCILEEIDHSILKTNKDDSELNNKNFILSDKNSKLIKLITWLNKIVGSKQSIKDDSKQVNARIANQKKKAIKDLLLIIKSVCEPTLNNLNPIIKKDKADRQKEDDQIINEMSSIKQKNEKRIKNIQAQYAAIQEYLIPFVLI